MNASLVVPLFNEEATVEPLLQSIVGQTRAPDELVCVDAGSTDTTAARVAAFRAPFPIVLLREGRLNPGEARNRGVERARHDWIAFTDAGIRLEPCWLEALMAEASRTGTEVVFGSYEPATNGLLRRSAALAYVPARGRQGVRGPSVASMALARSVFESVGGFPGYRAAEDLVFLEKIVQGGFRVGFCPAAVAHWETAPDVASTYRRFAAFSEANLAAGRGRFWHKGLARQYLLVGAGLVALAVAGAGARAFLLVPAWIGARALKAAWRKRGSFAFSTFHPAHLAGAMLVLLVLDVATAAGAARWLLRPLRRRAT